MAKSSPFLLQLLKARVTKNAQYAAGANLYGNRQNTAWEGNLVNGNSGGYTGVKPPTLSTKTQGVRPQMAQTPLSPLGVPSGGSLHTPPGEAGMSTALPGAPGHAATNVIDRLGGLDARGFTVDGNNAAGISGQSTRSI